MLLIDDSKIPRFNPEELRLTKYLFFTGKGGVGKTSISSALAVNLAEAGKKVVLVSTDPASNLQDVFGTQLDNKGVEIKDVPNLTVANFEPEESAREYRESVVGPYRGKLPQAAIDNMEEQLSGSCTTEIASFNEFSTFVSSDQVAEKYDYVIFDTAPTGHALRMLELPSARSNFIDQSTHGASCLGQLAGLNEKREVYKKAVETLANGEKTSLFLVARADEASLKEAGRASKELKEIGMERQLMVINGVLASYDDKISEEIHQKEVDALNNMPEGLKDVDKYLLPLKSYNIENIEGLKGFFQDETSYVSSSEEEVGSCYRLKDVVDDIEKSGKRLIFTMGKGGVGKTTLAATLALELEKRGKRVHLTTTDPANHLSNVIDESSGIEISNIDEKEELRKYGEEVIRTAEENHLSEDDIDYIKEDLRSPCTQEIAVFRAFAEIVDKSDDEIVIIDTAPTGHTLLLLESTENYDKEIKRTSGQTPESVKKLLPKLKDKDFTEVLIVSLAEATPFYEAKRLKEDLERANIFAKWWIINKSLTGVGTENKFLAGKAEGEKAWINRTLEESFGYTALVSRSEKNLKGENLSYLLGEEA